MINFKTSLVVLFLFFVQNSVLFSQKGKCDSFSSLEFKWSNDFECKTDRYYTNGFALEWVTSIAKKNPISLLLLPINRPDLELYSFTLIQDIYTPNERFNVTKQLEGDRPFASYLLLGLKKTSFSKINKTKISSKIELGVLGSAAFGEQTQNGIHRNLPTSDVIVGWKNQISNSAMLNYSVSMEKIFPIIKWFEASGVASAQLGVPFTNIGLGFKTRIGVFDFLPSEFEFCSSNKWQLFLTLSARSSLVGYNATLQGGLFSKSIYTIADINRFVGYATAGITARYKGFELEYVQHFNTPEFAKASSHSWAYLLIKTKL